MTPAERQAQAVAYIALADAIGQLSTAVRLMGKAYEAAVGEDDRPKPGPRS